MMTDNHGVDLSHSRNQVVLSYLQSLNPNTEPSLSPQQADTWQLGAHPDLVEHLWGDLNKLLPKDCRWVVYQTAVLVHPVSGVIFGFVGGTSTLMLRLPEPEREAAFQVEKYGRSYAYPTQTIYASEIGEDWALIQPYSEKRVNQWVLRAYEYAG